MYLSEQPLAVAARSRRRRHPRVQVQCRARIVIAGRHYAGYLDNISQAGARLRTISPIRKIGAVTLKLPDLPPLRCQLCWTDTYHAGVIFHLPLTSRQLHDWVASRSNASLQVDVAEVLELAV